MRTTPVDGAVPDGSMPWDLSFESDFTALAEPGGSSAPSKDGGFVRFLGEPALVGRPTEPEAAFFTCVFL